MSATVLTRRPLAISESYTQDKQDRFNDARPVGSVRGLIYADQAGAFYLEESDNDGASWTTTATVAVSASVTAPLAWTGLTKRWYRFRYANGATAQAKFILIQHSRDMELGDVQLTGSSIPIAQPLPIGGTASHDAAAAGNPVQMGGVRRTTNPALADGDAGSLRLNARSELISQKSIYAVTTTIINAQSVVAGGNTGDVNMGLDGTEDEVWIAISIDKQPWSMYPSSIFGNLGAGNCYPQYANKTSTFTIDVPAMALYVGINSSAQGLAAPVSINDAKTHRVPAISTVTCRVLNGHATDNATITVKILRIWR